MNNMNKKIYMLFGDECIVVGNVEEFVYEFCVGSWMDFDCIDEQYMYNFVECYVVQVGVRIVIDILEKFLFDFIWIGYVKEI